MEPCRRITHSSLRVHLIAIVAILLSLGAVPSTASAQAVSPGFDPLQPEKRFNALKQEQAGRDTPRLPATANEASARSGSRAMFEVRGFSIVGNQTIGSGEFQPLYQRYVGRKISERDLAELAEKITGLYRARGYHLARAIVPPQDIKNGIIVVKVVEGSITELIVDGDQQGRFGVKVLLSPVLSEQPSRQRTLERQLLLLNTLPGIRVLDTSLREIGAASGRFSLTVYVKTWQVYSFVGIDNLGSSSVGPWQTYATGAFNSYLVAGDALTLNTSTILTDPRQLGFGRLGYEAPVGIDGVRLGGSVLYSQVQPGDWRREYGDVTKTQSFELHASAVPLQSQLQTLTLTAGAQFTDVTERDVLGDIYRDHLRTISLTGDYRLKDDFGGVNYLTVTLRKGMDVLGASRLGDDFLSRTNGSGDFATINLWFARYQTLTDAWSLKISGAGQYASTELLTSQQFYLGGASFARGYGNAEISGDNAIAAAVELRFDGAYKSPWLRGYQFYAFIETGTAWNVGYRYSDGLSLTSAGGGLRLFFNNDLRADIGVGVPLSFSSVDNPTRNPRLLVSLSNEFRLCSAKAC